MMAFFQYFWEKSGAPQTGKVFGIFGSWHTDLVAGNGSDGPLAYLLNTHFEATTGRVASVSGQSLSGSFRSADGSKRSVYGSGGWIPDAAAKALAKALEHPYMICIEAEDQPSSAYILIRQAVPASDLQK